MPDEVSVNQLFDMAIGAERAAEGVYRRLQAMFTPHPDVVRFWSDYAAAEDSHARWLEHIRGTLDAEQLAAPADPHTVHTAQELLRFPVEQALQGISTLDDAYQLASEMESGETAGWGPVVPIGTLTVILLGLLAWLLSTMRSDG